MPKKIYQAAIQIDATAYIVADNEDEARRLLEEQGEMSAWNLRDDEMVTGRRYSALVRDDVSRFTLSPAITLRVDKSAALNEID